MTQQPISQPAARPAALIWPAAASAALPGAQVALVGASQVFTSGVPGNISFNTTNFADAGFDLSDPTAIIVTEPGRYFAQWAFSWQYLPDGTMPGGYSLQTGINMYAPATAGVLIISSLTTSVKDTPNTHSGSTVVQAVAGTAFRLLGYQATPTNQSSWRYVGENQVPPTLTLQKFNLKRT